MNMPTAPRRPAGTVRSAIKPVPVIVLDEHEPLRVFASNGRPLLEISYDEHGPAIRLAEDDLRLQCSGALDLKADSISLSATQDVVIQGRTIRLN